MAGIDMGMFIQKLHEYIEKGPSEEQKIRDDFTNRFFAVYDVIFKTSSEPGFSRTVDISNLSYEDLDFGIGQIERVPSAEVGYYEDPIVEEDLLRDRALKIYHHENTFSLDEFFRTRPIRTVEDYF